MQEMIFFFAKSMLKLIFSSKPKIIYIFSKEKQFLKYASVLALCKKTKHFFF